LLATNTDALSKNLLSVASPRNHALLLSYPVEIIVQLEEDAQKESFTAFLNLQNITDKFVYDSVHNRMTATVAPSDGLRIGSKLAAINILSTKVNGPKRQLDIDFTIFRVQAQAPTPNVAPVAQSDAATTAANSPVTIAVLANDSDADGDALAITAVTQGARGGVVNNGNGTVTYTPQPNISGNDTFTYTIDDGHQHLVTAMVTVTITPPPTVSEALANLEASGVLPILDRSASLAGMDSDGDGVRDDVETYIASLPDTPAQKFALRQNSRAIRSAMLMGIANVDSMELRTTSTTLGNAVHCLWTTYGQGMANAKLNDIRKVTVNTPERFSAYMQYNNKVSGFATRLPKGDTCESQ
jgi:hypothetical protein